MEYIAGSDVAQRLRSDGVVSLNATLAIAEGIAVALDYAYHEHAITHRDVKPANILVEQADSGQIRSVKLADFGIAIPTGVGESLTATGLTVGTMAYIAPERIAGREPDHRSDQYSLACTVFEMLTGTKPFNGSIATVLAAHAAQEPPSAVARNRALPQHVDAVLARALSKSPAERYPTSSDFVAALRGPTAATTQPWASIPPPADHQQPAAIQATESASTPAVFEPSPTPAGRRRRPPKPVARVSRTKRAAKVAARVTAVVAILGAGYAAWAVAVGSDETSRAFTVPTSMPSVASDPATASSDVYPADFVTATRYPTCDSIICGFWSRCVDGMPTDPRASVTCASAPRSCDDDEAYEMPMVDTTGTMPRWAPSVCVDRAVWVEIDSYCADLQLELTGHYSGTVENDCVVTIYNPISPHHWMVTMADGVCDDPQPAGTAFPVHCTLLTWPA